MLELLRMQRTSIAAGLAAIAVLLAADLLLPASWRASVRDNAFDLVLAADQRLRPATDLRTGPRIIVVDIDRRSLEAVGPWPWPRATIAALIDAIAAAQPAVVAIDILFAEHDARCPPGLDRLPAEAGVRCGTGNPSEGDRLLARTGWQVPLVLGFVLDPAGSGSMPQMPFATRGAPSLDELWSAAGAVAPPSILLEGAHGIGALSLPAARDGVVRNVPLLVGVGGRVFPGLALDALRVANGASTYLLQSAPPILATADIRIPFAADGFLRLVPVPLERHGARTLSALDVLGRKADAAGVAGAIVLLGGSAPELGGLRETATDALTPSVQIQADAIEQIVSGRFPRAIGEAKTARALVILALGLLALAAGVALSPLLGALALVAMIATTWAAAIAGSLLTDRLVDPLMPSLAAVAVFAVAAVTSFAVTYRREVLVRRRFEQRLAPAVVRRIVEQPSLVKLDGEAREVTALFTDVEGFTAMTHRAGPEQLVAVLDDYFEGVTAIVVRHGGMVDKIVGDAVHALFNAPIDLDGHPQRAVECAIEIRAWAESYRARPLPSAIGFGRTRIGIETGEAIVGDIGVQAKLDYTAHGDAVNAAARLEAANKDFGSAICVGPTAAARCDAAMLRPLGTISVRGRDEAMTVFEPWPDATSRAWRERYLEAFRLIDREPRQAAAQLETLAIERADDPVVREMAKRLGAGADRAYA
jgi:adenylate cyclase